LGAQAQARTKLTIISHRVHQQTATEGPGGDVLKAWTDANNVTLEWVTLDLNAIHDRVFREARLGASDVAISFVLNTRAVPGVMGLFESLEPYQSRAPIEEFDDIAPGMVKAFTHRGQRHGIPYRHAVNGLHYNETFLKERGLDRPPQVVEEVLDYARRLTYTRADGNRVFGWGFQADNYSDVVKLARAFGGDFITDDYKCVAAGEGMVKALTLLRTMYVEGLMPRNITAMKQNDLITAMQSGQIAFCYFPFGRTVLFNDPRSSRFPGAFKVALPLVNPQMLARGEVIATAEFWNMTIPRNSRYKELAWSLIRELSTKDNTIRTAINGNGPVRTSAYADPRLVERVPYAPMEARALKGARVPMPAFDKAAEAKDVFVEEMQAALLGFQTPEISGRNMQRRIQPMLARL
jgi:multiple sugar transport system substrate-binding protein